MKARPAPTHALDRCDACEGPLRQEVVHRYPDPLFGLPNVVLLDGVTRTLCAKCNVEESILLPNMVGALAAAALVRIQHPARLDGLAIRYLRRALELEAQQLAPILGVRLEQVSRWEHDKAAIGSSADKLLRLLVVLRLASRAPGIPSSTDAILETEIVEPTGPVPVVLRWSEKGREPGRWIAGVDVPPGDVPPRTPKRPQKARRLLVEQPRRR